MWFTEYWHAAACACLKFDIHLNDRLQNNQFMNVNFFFSFFFVSSFSFYVCVCVCFPCPVSNEVGGSLSASG